MYEYIYVYIYIHVRVWSYSFLKVRTYAYQVIFMGFVKQKSSRSKLNLINVGNKRYLKPTRQQIEYSTKVIKLSCFVLFKLKCVGICCLFACLSDWWICLGSLHEDTCYEKLCLAFTFVKGPGSYLLSSIVECPTQSHIP